MPDKPQKLDPRKLAQDALELDERFRKSDFDPNFAWELSISNMTVATALLAALDRVEGLQGKLAESERWSLVVKRLYYDELAKNGRFECCFCGEVASDGVGHKCKGKKGEVGS